MIIVCNLLVLMRYNIVMENQYFIGEKSFFLCVVPNAWLVVSRRSNFYTREIFSVFCAKSAGKFLTEASVRDIISLLTN